MKQIINAAAVSGTRSVSLTTRHHVRPTRAERNLELIASGARLVDVYSNEIRRWWDYVSEDKVYEAISDPLAEGLVRLDKAIS